MSIVAKTRDLTAAKNRVPLAAAAVELGLNRERLLRRIQSGAIAGNQVDGFWYVDRRALEAYKAARASADAADGIGLSPVLA